MEKTLQDQRDPEGVGLAANQIGVDRQVAVVRFNTGKERSATLASFGSAKVATPHFLALVNPRIVNAEKETRQDYEGCLSLPDQYGKIKRALSVEVEAQDLKGEKIKIKAEGFLARIIQHELDHLDGKLITKRVKGKFYTGKELEEMLAKKNA